MKSYFTEPKWKDYAATTVTNTQGGGRWELSTPCCALQGSAPAPALRTQLPSALHGGRPAHVEPRLPWWVRGPWAPPARSVRAMG